MHAQFLNPASFGAEITPPAHFGAGFLWDKLVSYVVSTSGQWVKLDANCLSDIINPAIQQVFMLSALERTYSIERLTCYFLLEHGNTCFREESALHFPTIKYSGCSCWWLNQAHRLWDKEV